MAKLDLDQLKQYKSEILKAEIGALLFNLGKTHIGFWKEKEDKDGNKISYFNIDENSFKNIYGFGPFSGYRKYYQRDNELNKSPFEYELEKNGLKDFIFNRNISFPFNVLIKDENRKEEREKIEWQEIFKGDASEIEFIKRVFFRGCENINSGIDKGSPNKQLEPPLWLSNAFGSFKEEIKEHNFDQRRICFYTNLSRFLSINGYFQNPNWNEIRNFILKEIKDWYSHLLSDSRFPINDVTLFDQAYMTASMFKAVLSQLVMNSSKINDYQDNPSLIKWRILGIQYDKFGIAEKGLKLASIQWYREITEKIDEEIKKLLEVEYPIGNEIYRDETGIYFIVGEDLGKDENSNITKLKNELRELESKIYEIFEKATEDEFYPAIFLTKASRGLMNLSYLIENAKNNFLKANRKKDLNLCLINTKKGKAIGICPVCQVRLIYESDKEKNNSPTICETCDDRIHHKQVSKWIDNISDETIWLDEVKDKNNRIAYISLKFELEDWLNGNLLNSFLRRIEQENIKEFIKTLVKLNIKIRFLIEEIGHQEELFKNVKKLGKYLQKDTGLITGLPNFIENLKVEHIFEVNLDKITKLIDENNLIFTLNEDNFDKNIKLGEIKSKLEKIDAIIKTKFMSIPSELLREISTNDIKNKFINLYDEIIKSNLLEILNLLENLRDKLNVFYNLYPESLKGIRKNNDNLNDFFKQIFFDHIIGTKWEIWIKTTSLNSKIDWREEKLKWGNFSDENDPALDLLATLLLQFLLRKNPSPARLRRIWETTREFFEDIHKDLDNILEIPEWRKKRPVWKINLNENNKLEKSIELEADGLLFWVEKKNNNEAEIYLISSIRDFLLKFGNNEIKKYISENKDDLINRKIISLKENILKEKLILKPYNSQNDDKNYIEIVTDDFSEIKDYKPFAKITDPSPKNYQIVIPAEYLERFLDKVMERYNKEFKYVYGKLPLHIGIVVSHYKKPAYVNLKALRRIRRDVKNISFLRKKLKWDIFGKIYTLKLKNISRKFREDYIREIKNRTHIYYSLYWFNLHKEDYNFYIRPDYCWKKWLAFHTKFRKNKNNKITYYPNTFDFEFMDTNTRRNDIFYDEGNGYKRAIPDKSNRPYEIEEYWDKFKEFRRIFKDKSTSSKLHNLVHILYDKLKDFDEKYAPLLASSFIKILELNKKENKEIKKSIAFIFDIKEEDNQNFHKKLKSKLEKEENIKLFLDMFEFWHTMLKEV